MPTWRSGRRCRRDREPRLREGPTVRRRSVRPDFGARAADYERLRPVDENWLEVFEVVVREADLRGGRVLDVGCGTGKFSRVLAERRLAWGWGVERCAEMPAEARARVPCT